MNSIQANEYIMKLNFVDSKFTLFVIQADLTLIFDLTRDSLSKLT